jgi:multiple antibiotic resistance protein
MSLSEYTLLAVSSLFVIVDPIAVVPAFLAITPNDTPAQRARMALLASAIMTGVLLIFAISGPLIFRFLGITLPAFQIAGSIVLLLIALDMLRAQRSRVNETREDTEAAAAKVDIAITPLAIPMLAGPGAISSVVLLRKQAENWMQEVALCGGIVVVAIASYLILRVSAKGVEWLNPIGMRIATRIMGLLLAAVASQFMINALRELKLIPGP